MIRVIYRASAAHSGSTLLDMMLNANPEIISVGEPEKGHYQSGMLMQGARKAHAKRLALQELNRRRRKRVHVRDCGLRKS
jgi:hypothetical protein